MGLRETAISAWTTIKNETVRRANTALRVGNAGLDIINYIDEQIGVIDDNANERFKNRGLFSEFGMGLVSINDVFYDPYGIAYVCIKEYNYTPIGENPLLTDTEYYKPLTNIDISRKITFVDWESDLNENYSLLKGTIVRMNGTGGDATSEYWYILIQDYSGTKTAVNPLNSPSYYFDITGHTHLNDTLKPNVVEYQSGATVPTNAGSTYYDDTYKVLSTVLGNGVVLQNGLEMYVRVVNKTGSQLNDGQVVYISGAQGNRPTASLAIATSELASYVIGVCTENIANNQEGFVTVFGTVNGYNTSSFTDGAKLYLSATVAGELTTIRPVAPNHGVIVGIALNSTNNGAIFVNPNSGFELSELHDVDTTKTKTAPLDADYILLQDTADNNIWKKVTKLNTDEVYIGATAPLNNQKLWVDTSVQSSSTYALRTEIGDRHGFILPPNTSNFTFDNSTRTFVLLTNAGDFKINGATFLINSVPLANRTIQIGTGPGQHFIWLYLNNGVPTLQTSQTSWNIMDLTVIPVATVHWDGATGIVGDELHQASRNLIEHQKQHDTDGCRWVSGGATTFGDSQNNNFSSAVAVVRDEDRYHTIAAKTTAQIGYRVSSGATMTFDTAGAAVCKLNGNVVRYDNGGTLTDVTSGNYVGYYMYFTNRKATTGATSPEIVFIMGQAQYGSIASLQAGAQPTLAGISVAEWKLAYRVIFRQQGTQFVYVQADDLRSTTTGLAVSGGGVSNDPSKASKSTFTSDSSTSGTINIAINETRYLSTTLTNSHTITITPLKPVSVSETLVSSIIFKVGASAPSITITPDSGVTHTWMNTAPSSFTINKANEIMFVWISTTECLVYSKEQS